MTSRVVPEQVARIEAPGSSQVVAPMVPPVQGGEVTRMKALGRHLIVEFWGAENLNDPHALELGLKEAVEAIDGNLLDLRVVTFPVHGVTGVAIIAESHVAVHTWPEYGYAAVDIFTCNLEADIAAGVEALKRHLLAERVQVMEVRRGLLP